MVEVVTLGCRINSYESEILKEKFAGTERLIIVNTCAVTREAERQCRQTVRKLRRENPDAKIVVTGCAAQINPKSFARMPEVDLVLGNREKAELEKYIRGEIVEKTIVGDIFSYDKYDDFVITGFEGRQRAFVQIQQGCDHRCTYCIVPFARGNNRSVPEDEVLRQIGVLLEKGFEEICLTGVDACSYKPSFSGLVKKILEAFPSLPSLQFGSLDPAARPRGGDRAVRQNPRGAAGSNLRRRFYLRFSDRKRGGVYEYRTFGRRSGNRQTARVSLFRTAGNAGGADAAGAGRSAAEKGENSA